ncbi:MAG: restriction endonuclease subunit S [Gemmatimonadaceae bacterium]|nr:restriction endonuclease subunit S [Gemmatimonadaceae bacterium]
MAGEALASVGTKSWLYHPVFPDHWERRALHSLAQWVNGLAFRDIQFSPTGKPVIKIAEIKGGISGQTKFTEQVFDESVHVRAGDLLFSWSGQPETSIDVFWWRGTNGWLNQHSFRVTPVEAVDRTFFFYLLRYLKPSFVGIARNKQTTGLGHVTKRDLENIEAAYPSLPEQRAIAHILGTLDDKIELNRRMNETLEAMARALFKSWFVDFDPVRAKAEGRDPGLPKPIADLFPDSFEDSELGEIPKGWAVELLSEITSVITKGTTPTHSDTATADEADLGINYVRVNAIDEDGAVLFDKLTTIPESVHLGVLKRSVLHVSDVLYTIAGTIGRIAIVDESLLPANTNQAIAIVRPKQAIPATFLVMMMREAAFREELHSNIVQAVQANLSLAVLSRARIVAAPQDTLPQLFMPTADLMKRVTSIRAESRTLAALRDTLLPKLISGELRLQDVSA